MKAASFVAAGLIVVLANAFALMHAARNRSGAPEAEVTLTQRELPYSRSSPSDEDSGVTLNLQWTGPGILGWPASDYPNWLDERKLRSLGFDCSVNPASAAAARFYERQRPRRVFVALENDGPAWQAWIQRATAQPNHPSDLSLLRSHLVAIDADLDAGKLRARNPDRKGVLVLPAVVAIGLRNYPYPLPATVQGSIRDLPSSIHVPRPFSDEFRQRTQQPAYQVHLRYGSAREPSVTGVAFTK